LCSWVVGVRVKKGLRIMVLVFGVRVGRVRVRMGVRAMVRDTVRGRITVTVRVRKRFQG
jgi:hypothetical protein